MAIDCDAASLSADTLGVLYNAIDPSSEATARLYATTRRVAASHVIGIRIPVSDTLTPQVFSSIRAEAIKRLPINVQSLLLVWSRPYAVGCMSITTAFAAGYRPELCEPGCGATAINPLYDSDGWLPADTVGWWPAMLMPSDDQKLARQLIERGVSADSSHPQGSVYLVSTADSRRNVRASTYSQVELLLADKVRSTRLVGPPQGEISDAIGYFTGAAQVTELRRVHFRPGAIADHLTSTGGVLFNNDQTSALAWLIQGASGSYGTVSEPCNSLSKFPNIGVLLKHYLRGESLLESYWKSVQMPGQGLFIGEPLARPYAIHRQ